jgi:hypothetical protein
MPRGVAHPPELRAQVVAAVTGGLTIAQAARKFGLDHGLVSRWAAAGVQLIAREKTSSDTDLVMAYFRAGFRALIAQAEVFGDPDYCRSQEADKLAIAHGVLGDKLAGVAATAQALGLIGLLSPTPTRPVLEAGSAAAAYGPADDDR